MSEHNLRAYFYSFEPTGCDPVDRILAAVARAGKSFHHTEEWSDQYDDQPSCIDRIQAAAGDAAKTQADLLEALTKIQKLADTEVDLEWALAQIFELTKAARATAEGTET